MSVSDSLCSFKYNFASFGSARNKIKTNLPLNFRSDYKGKGFLFNVGSLPAEPTAGVFHLPST